MVPPWFHVVPVRFTEHSLQKYLVPPGSKKSSLEFGIRNLSRGRLVPPWFYMVPAMPLHVSPSTLCKHTWFRLGLPCQQRPLGSTLVLGVPPVRDNQDCPKCEWRLPAKVPWRLLVSAFLPRRVWHNAVVLALFCSRFVRAGTPLGVKMAIAAAILRKKWRWQQPQKKQATLFYRL